jgi:hypothetical protein
VARWTSWTGIPKRIGPTGWGAGPDVRGDWDRRSKGVWVAGKLGGKGTGVGVAGSRVEAMRERHAKRGWLKGGGGGEGGMSRLDAKMGSDGGGP